MVPPSLEAARITVQLLGQYRDEEHVENAIKLGYFYQAPEDFLREYFAQSDYSEELQDDVAEFFFKVLKYRKYLEIIEDELVKERSSLPGELSTKAIPSSPVNIVLLYLLVFELSECTKSIIEELIISINKEKALLISTTLKRQDSITRLFELASQIWDVEYVKEVLKNVLQKHFFEEICETVASRGRKSKHIEKKKLTVPIAPKFTKCSRKYVTPKETVTEGSTGITRIPVLIKANPIPVTTYFRRSTSLHLQRAYQKNREEAVRKYKEAQRDAFRCANLEKSEKFRKVIEQIEMERRQIPVKRNSWNKIKFGKPHYPKKTAAVILREGARLLKLEQDEIKRIEDIERGGFNEDQVAELENEVREAVYRQEVEDLEKKHLEVLLSFEEALISKQKYLKEKKERADEFRKERENWMLQLEMWRKEEQLRIQERFERGKAVAKGAKEALEHVKEEKHKLALETMEESRALKEKWLKEKQQDLQRKVQLIKEIKALQAFGVIRRKHATSSDAVTLGLLCEMSTEELKERLFIIKLELQEELERRRAKVKMRQECRKDIINSYQELIESHQRVMQENKQSSEHVMRDESKNKTRLTKTSPSLDYLRQKLYEKRRERINQQIMC